MNNNKALYLLRDGFKTDFAVSVFESEAFAELIMDQAFEFVNDNVPIVDEDDRLELATLLMDSLKLGNY